MLPRALLLLVLAMGFGSPCLAGGETRDDVKAPLKRLHAYFESSPEIQFLTTFSSTSDTPGMNKRGTAHFFLRQRNQCRVEVSSNSGDYVFVSDGKTFTLYRPGDGEFARVRARSSIIGTMYVAVGLLNLHASFLDF